MKITILAVIALAGLGMAGNASAGTIAYDNAAGTYTFQTYGTVGSLQDWGGSLGLEFKVNSPITVTALGAFDNGNIANLDSQGGVTVGIYNANTATLVGSPVTFTTGSPGYQIQGDTGDVFKLISGLTLTPGNYTVVTFGDYNFNEGYGATAFNPTSVENSDGGRISFVGSGLYSGSEVYPTSVDSGPANRYDAGTFVVPDGGLTASLLGGALIGLQALRRKLFC